MKIVKVGIILCIVAQSQWETTLHCNVVSHWLGAHKKWSPLKAQVKKKSFVLPSWASYEVSNLMWMSALEKMTMKDGCLHSTMLPSWPSTIAGYIEAETKWLPFCRPHFQMYFFKENYCIQISENLVPMSSVENKPVLVQIMAHCWIGNKVLSEPPKFIGIIMLYSALMR